MGTWGGGVFELPSDRGTLPSWLPVALRSQLVGVVAVSPDGTKLVAAPATGGTLTMTLASVSTDTDAEPTLPSQVELRQNYPNPFNPQTTISFGLPESGQVRLTVHDLTGRLVATLVDGVVAAGAHEVGFRAGDLPSGAYLYRLQTPVGSLDRMMILLK